MSTTTETSVPPVSDVSEGLKRFVLRFCVSVTLLLLLLALGELVSYIFLRLNPPPPVYGGLPLRPDYARELEDSAKHQYLPFVEWRRQAFRGRFITVDKDGVRQTLNSHCDDPHSLQIWMFGDSALWGTGVDDANTLPSHLARLYSQSGQSVCIKNYGEAAWVSTQELIQLLLQLKHAGRRPDIVVFYDGTDEIFMPDPDAPQDVHQGYRRFRELLNNAQAEAKPGLLFLDKSNTVRALELLAKKMNRRRNRPKNTLAAPEVQSLAKSFVDNYEKNLQVVDALSRTYGFRPFYFWYPTSSFGNKPLTQEERRSIREEIQGAPARYQLKQATFTLCSKLSHPDFFFLGDALDGQSNWIYLDGAHLTGEGNGIMAEKLFEILRGSKASVSR